MTDLRLWPAKSSHLYIRRSMRWAVLLLAVGGARAEAQSCSDVCELYGGLLLAPERALIGTFRQLEKIAKPVVGPRNTRGRWIQRDVYLGQNAFDTTFYFKSGRVQRIEMVSSAPDAQCRSHVPWSGAIAALEAWQGKHAVQGQFDAGDNVGQSVHWSGGNVDVTVYLSVTKEACYTKVAFKPHDAKDASQL